MSKKYIRNARLRVGTTGTLEREYKGFRVTFRVEKTLEPSPNTASIQIYNLNETSRARIEAKDAIVSLDTGYGENLEQLFIGNIARASSKIQGSDVITDIEAGDGEKAFKEAVVDKSFPAGTDANSVISSVSDALKEITGGGITSVKSFVLTQVKNFSSGLSLSGTASSILDKITKTVGAEWSVQDGELQIIEQGKATPETAFKLSEKTGVVGSPGKLKGKLPDGKENDGVSFESFLNPVLRPGRLVLLESFSVNGIYRITKVTHEGDSHSGTWLSKCEGSALK